MGTDIHGRVQRRYSPTEPYEDVGPIEDERSYEAFAMLAGVRNGFGFGGCKTHEPLTPISDPRGLPDDNPKYEDNWIFGDHSQSWLTLREVLDWPFWDQDFHMTGYLSREEYDRVIREGCAPKSWCGDSFGQRIVKTTHEAVQSGEAPEGWTDVSYEWRIQFRERVRVFRLWLDYIEAKHGWLLENDPAAIRLVFGFDS